MTAGNRARAIEDLYELSPAQRGMFFHTIYGPKRERHLQQLSCTLEGELDVPAFEQAWQQVIDRHPALRTSFHAEHPDKPLQVVRRRLRLKLDRQDLSQLPAAQREKRCERFLEEDRDRDFDLARPPLMRLALLRLTERTHLLVWTRHHLLLDGWSLSILLEEVFAFYEAFHRGLDPHPGKGRPYRDYILWLQDQDQSAAEAFWRARLDGLKEPAVFGTPREGSRPAVGERYGEGRARLPESVTADLRALARERRLTLNTLVQAAWAVLLSRYTRSEEVVFGVTVSGRPESLEGSGSIVGLLINTLPLRLGVESQAALLPWLEDLQATQGEMYRHGYVSLSQIQEWSGVPAGRPLFESLLVFENFPAIMTESKKLPGDLEIHPSHDLGARTDFPLALLAVPGERLELRCVYDSRRFEAAWIGRMLEHFEAVLGAMAEEPGGHLGSLPPAVEEILQPLAAQGAPADPARPICAPTTPLERSLAEIWCELLGISEVDVHTPFFDLGGHSLLATQIVARVRESLQVDVPLRQLAESPTIAQLAAAIPRQEASSATPAPALPKIEPDARDLGLAFPLTDVQYAYWIGRSGAMELGDVASHRYLELESRELDLAAFTRAWRRLVERHPMLRAIVLPDATQRILTDVPDYEIVLRDLRGESPRVAEAELRASRERMSHQKLVLDEWPLFEILAFRLPEGRLRVCLSFDYLIADAWSFRILLRELMELYENPAARLPELEISFRDYVLAERALRRTELYRRAREYWQNRLPELPLGPELPLAGNPGELGRQRFRQQLARLEPQAWQRLQSRAAQAGLSPSGVLLAAYAEVLALWSRNPCFSIVLTLFNRHPFHPQVDALIGDFTSTTLLGVDHDPKKTFESRARHLQERLWDDLDHRYVSGVEVARELRQLRQGTPQGTSLVVFTSTLGLSRREDGAAVQPKLPGEVVYAISQTPQVLLDHQVSEREGALVFNWDSVEDIFPPGMLEEMFAAYRNLLQRLAAEDEVWESADLELIPGAQLQRRARVNATHTALPEGLLHAPFLERAARHPQRRAVMTPGRSLTYGELRCAAARVARGLSENGARAGVPVAVVMEKGWEQVVAVLGALGAAAPYLPIDPHLPQERLAYLLEHGEVELALTQKKFSERLAESPHVRALAVDGDDFDRYDNEFPEPSGDPAELAYLIFTSGSTGSPKGVMIDHRGALNTIADVNSRFAVDPSDRVLSLSALGFDLSVYDLFGLLAVGGTVVMPDPGAAREPAHWLELMRGCGVTLWNTVPALMELLVDDLEVHRQTLPESLRLVLLSGDWIPVTLPDRIRALAAGGEITVLSLGGATEASIWSILYPIGEVEPSWKSIPYGRPMANQEFHVLRSDLGPSPDWTPGDLYIGGRGLARGYWRDEEKTRSSFVVHPQSDRRLYRTGDVGRYLPDGNIEFLGRDDFQVKVRGYRIELGEIEAALAQHPSVRAAVVAKLGKEPREQRLVAYVVCGRSADDERAEMAERLRGFLEEKLPEYMVPSAFVILLALPLSANGKVDRQRLPVPEEPEPRSSRDFARPRSMVEEIVAGIFCRVLDLERVGLDDDFFELGGHSLSATQVVSRIDQAFRRRLPLGTLFEFPTVAGLAANIEALVADAPATGAPALEPMPREGAALPLSLAQRRLWFLHKLEVESSAFNVATAARLVGELHLAALERAIQEIVRRHESIRTSFVEIEGEARQVIASPSPWPLPILDLSGLARGEHELERVLDEERHRPFDLARGPLLRVLLLRQTRRQHVILATMHHIVSDGWSLGILLRDLTDLYEAFSQGRPSPLPELPVQYVDYAHWQRRWLRGEAMEEQLAYWRDHLSGELPRLELPGQRPRPLAPRFRGESQKLRLKSELTRELEELSRREGVTLFATLLAALKTLLHLYTGQEELLVGTSSANRTRPEIENLIGFFLNPLALRTDLSGNPSFRELMIRVRDVSIGAFAHQDVPFEELIEALQPKRYLNRAPLFQVLFVFQNFPLEVRELPGLSVHPIELSRRTTHFDLIVMVAEEAGSLVAALTYDLDLFDAALITRLSEDYQTILKKVSEDPEMRIADLTLVDKSKSQELVNAFNLDLEAT